MSNDRRHPVRRVADLLAQRVTRRVSRRAHDATVERAAHGQVSYGPERDGHADPGEVVWAWVPYEDDPRRGKDRPVLVLARRGPRLLCLMLSSQDHDLDAADEARHGRRWMDVGTGGWDREGRPSEVRLDRLLELDDSAVRREGAALARPTFDAVVAAARELHPSLR